MADEKPKPVQGEPYVIEHPKPPKKPLVAPDGHENLTQEDIDARG
jgi:hypothetical protein